MQLRVFRNNISWLDDIVYLFSMDITWKEITKNVDTALVEKKDFVGIMNFDKKFLSMIKSDYINGKVYYYFNNGCRK